MANITYPTKWLTMKDLIAITGFSKSFIYQRINDGTFPKPLKVCGSSNRWTVETIREWMEAVSQSPESPDECT